MTTRTIRLLLVEDDKVDRMAFERMVREQRLRYEVDGAPTLREARARLDKERYDVVVLDYLLEDGTALELLPHLKDTPAIFVTGSGDERVAVDAMKQGAYDYLIKDPDRHYLTVLPATVENVLKRKQAEDALRESQERLRAIVESLPDLVFETDRRGVLTFMSPACREVLGYGPEEMIGRPLEEFATERDRKTTEEVLRGILREGRQVSFYHSSWRHRDGADRIMSMNARPYRGRRGEPLGIRGAIRDITELKKTEAALEETRRLANRTHQELVEARAHALRLRGHLGQATDFEGLVGRHPKMMELYEKIRLAATTDVAVHIYGPSGSGKELVAHALHNLSARREKPFVVVNCSAIPETLVESTLFGHVKGAYTGATTDAIGYLGRAEGGTLFLDEIGDLSALIQVKLLRFLQEHTYERVGDAKPRTADARIITATHQDLWSLVKEGKMREDFYYRISVFPLEVPPLSERRSDISLLVAHFVKRIGGRMGKRIEGVSQAVMEAFAKHSWPGNVRELENVLEYACVVCRGAEITLADLPPHFHARGAESGPGHVPDTPEQLREVLDRFGWNRTRAARALGISRVTLWKKMKACGLQPPGPGGRTGKRTG